MAKIEDDFDDTLDNEELKPQIDKKKILIFLLPVLIVIGLVVSFYSVFSQKISPDADLPYTVVDKGAVSPENDKKLLVFYDLPEISVQIKNAAGNREFAKLRLSIEIPSIDDAKTIEGLMPEISDAVIAHTIELTDEELSGADGLYWLKEELLYRINLITDPVKVSNLNFKNFEIQKN